MEDQTMDFFDQKFNSDDMTDGFEDDFSDDFFSGDDFGTEDAQSVVVMPSKFNRAGRNPEPINLGSDAPTQQPFTPQFTPATGYREVPVYYDDTIYPEVSDNSGLPEYQEDAGRPEYSDPQDDLPVQEEAAYEEAEVQPYEDEPEEDEVQPYEDEPEEAEVQPYEDEPEEAEVQPYEDEPEEAEVQPYEDEPEEDEVQPYAEEAPVVPEPEEDPRTPAERLIEYADCHYKLIPAGTEIDLINRKYLYSLHYGKEWDYSTVLIPVSEELAETLCLDANGRQMASDVLRTMRKNALADCERISGTDELENVYVRKTAVMGSKGISIDEFEHNRAKGASITCFSSFTRNGVTTKDILIVQVPVSEPWKVFAWFPVGGINGAPSNEDLMAASKHWYELCGAVPAVLGYSVVEYFVPNGRPSYETSLRIAREQFALCHERVLRLTHSHTLSELVDTLMKSCVWYLGWK